MLSKSQFEHFPETCPIQLRFPDVAIAAAYVCSLDRSIKTPQPAGLRGRSDSLHIYTYGQKPSIINSLPGAECMPSKPYKIAVDVETQYISEQSLPDQDHFVFAYTITISNHGEVPAQLLRRHWVITDANNKVQEVKGDGVVGEQPHLKPGESYRYTSGTMLETPVGTMRGNYHMIADDGVEFDAEIPQFTLSMPRTLH